jgi:hypothetical protein
MNCSECKDRIFELIEREAVDPEGVRAIMANCPDCRRLFEEMKTALAAARELPLEEPPADRDQAILRAAAARRPEAGTPAKRWLQAPPWAMAAIALLALGLGVWGLPETQELAPRRDDVPDALVQAELKPAPGAEAGDRQEPAMETLEEESRAAAGRDAGRRAREEQVGRRAATARDAQAKRASAATSEQKLAGAADRAAADGMASGAPPSEGTPAPAPASEAAEPAELSLACQERLDRVEEIHLEAGDPKVAPEEALAIGLCFRAAGKTREARAWLERAAADPRTRARARRLLRELGAD